MSWDEFLLAGGFQGMSSKKKIGRPKSKKRFNVRVEEQRDKPSFHSHNQEDEPSSHSHQQDEVDKRDTMQKSYSLGRLTRKSAWKIGLPPPNPLPTVKPFSETYVRRKKRPFSSSQKAKSP